MKIWALLLALGGASAVHLDLIPEGVGFAQEASNPMESVPLVGSQFKVDPVSTSLNCVITLSIQFFLIFTALAVVRTLADVWKLKYDNFPIQEALKTASLTVCYAPMLAVLFLAVRMRVTWLTQGKGNPPEWMQAWMYATTYAVLAMSLVVLVIPIFTGRVIGVDPQTGEIDPEAKPFTNWIAAYCFTALKFLIMIGLYVGVLAVIYGTITFEPPKGTWPDDVIPPVSPAVGCTMILACMYFIVYAGVQVGRTYTQLTGAETTSVERALMTATNAMNFAPMLSVLFIGARMRALQMDPVNGAPQPWAQNCFYMCTYATAAQVIISVAVPLAMPGGEVKASMRVEGDMEYKVENATLAKCLTAARYVIMFCIYVGASCVIYSVLTIEHPRGPQFTPAISSTMQCVINLTFQFFFIYVGIWILVSIEEFNLGKWPLVTNTLQSLIGTVMFCPMLAILFVGTRMRALLLTDNRGAPQGYAQDGMFMATWAVLVQFLMGLMVPLATGAPGTVDADGTPTFEVKSQAATYGVLALKWLTYIFLYGGIVAVLVGVYSMTPQNANGRGSVPVIGDHVGEPVGVNDIPGVNF